MIKLARLDERLIHGQVAVKWSRLLEVDRIIVANDAAASDDVMQKALMMAAPEGIKVAIVPLDRCIELCNDPRSAVLKILVIVASPQDLLRIAREVHDVPKINIGNYGRMAPRNEGHTRKGYSANVYADELELAVFGDLIATGIPCEVQTIPDDTPQMLERVLGLSA